jgi:hypothetical protein
VRNASEQQGEFESRTADLTGSNAPEARTALALRTCLMELLGGALLKAAGARLPYFVAGYTGIEGDSKEQARTLALFQSQTIMAVLGVSRYALEVEAESSASDAFMEERRQAIKRVCQEAVSSIGLDAEEYLRAHGDAAADLYHRYFKKMETSPKELIPFLTRFLTEFLLLVSGGSKDQLAKARDYSLKEVTGSDPLVDYIAEVHTAFAAVKTSCHD